MLPYGLLLILQITGCADRKPGGSVTTSGTTDNETTAGTQSITTTAVTGSPTPGGTASTPGGTTSTTSSATEPLTTAAASSTGPSTATVAETDTGVETDGGIPQGGTNPCGTCPEGQYCNALTDDDPDCGGDDCEAIPVSCAACFADPAACAIQRESDCLHELCYGDRVDPISFFAGASVADDGTIVVFCDPYGDTDCTI
jgi:hypothetical protein